MVQRAAPGVIEAGGAFARAVVCYLECGKPACMCGFGMSPSGSVH